MPDNTVGRPIVPHRKAMDGIVYVLNRIPVENATKRIWFCSICHRRFQEWVKLDVFKKMRIGLLKECDNKKGIKGNWQALDSISIKSPLGGGR
jgi:hypothetical protein